MKIEIIANIDGKTISNIDKMTKGQAQQVFWDDKPCLLLTCYKCNFHAFTSSHNHTFHEDGTVTLTPSVVCPKEGCDAHYYIRKSEIVPC